MLAGTDGMYDMATPVTNELDQNERQKRRCHTLSCIAPNSIFSAINRKRQSYSTAIYEIHISRIFKMTGICSSMLEMAHPKVSRHVEERIELNEKEKRLRSGKATTIFESFC